MKPEIYTKINKLIGTNDYLDIDLYATWEIDFIESKVKQCQECGYWFKVEEIDLNDLCLECQEKR